MSSLLYAIGRWCYRHSWRVIVAWFGVLAAVGGLSLALAGHYDDRFSIPSASSQAALIKLRMTFPEASGMSALAVVVPPAGILVTDPTVKRTIEDSLKLFSAIDIVGGVVSPWDEHVSGLVAADARAAIVQVRLSKSQVFADQLKPLEEAAAEMQARLPVGSTVTMGGEAFSIELPHLSWIEALGVMVALVVLSIVLGSLIAAGMPIVTALVGVGITMAIMMLLARVTTINSVTPMLAVMLGLAVGIDYALFILSRHRDQLRDPGISVEESTARAVATAGSAVVFAGVTVVIALLGLTLVLIPFITVMGAFAALGVTLAVLIALTLLPAFMALLGERLRPKAARQTSALDQRPEHVVGLPRTAKRPKRPGRIFELWVKGAIKWPWLTVATIVTVGVLVAIPAKDLHLSLPNAGQHAASASDRVAYDQAAEYFGVGFNGPLIVTADLLSSTDPLGVMAGMKADILTTAGVQSVLIATPNQNADTGFVQVIPTTAPDDPATQLLVEALRAKASSWVAKYGVTTAVTGMTAIQIDVSDRLAAALLPFGLFVVGLSLVLLAVVFRSIAVPIKAALGYLLSVGVAFGASTLVFNHGWFKSLVNLEKPMAIISFLPILLMGILFGLAMDYEVFLVSRIREEYVHGRSARDAIVQGFIASGKVVAGAAIIMVAVFAFFVPQGMGPIKNIAFGLAIGILVDAFVVRMTLVPAVLAILGDKAWWLPQWLDKRLPSLDIEGESLARELKLIDWPGDGSALHSEQLAVDPVLDPLDLSALPGSIVAIVGEGERAAAMLALSGRLRTTSGRARVAGALLPEQASQVRRASAFIDPTQAGVVAHELNHALRRHTRVVFIDNADLLATEGDKSAVAALITQARAEGQLTVILGGANHVVLDGFGPDFVVPARSDHVEN